MTFNLRMGDVLAFLALLVAFVLVTMGSHVDAAGWGGVSLGMAVVQSTYSDEISEAVAGMAVNMTNWDVDTRICESAAIGFGLACAQGTNDKGALLGGALADFVGVSVRDITLVHDTPDQYEEADNLGVANEGDWWVQTSVATSPTDPVHYDATTGIFAISGGSGPIVGARWMKSRGAGLGCLRLSGHLPVP